MDNKLSFTGKVEAITNQRSGETKKGDQWKSIDIVVKETSGDYPQSASFTAGTKKYAEAIACRIGEEVTIHFNFKCNLYKDRYYNSLDIWKIEKVSSGGAVEQREQFGSDMGENLPF